MICRDFVYQRYKDLDRHGTVTGSYAHRLRRITMAKLLATCATLALSVLRAQSSPPPSSKPNIVVIMSDDQDFRLGSLKAQSFVQREIMAKGVTLENHFATVAQCCPSRTSFLRGQQPHNTNLTHVAAPG